MKSLPTITKSQAWERLGHLVRTLAAPCSQEHPAKCLCLTPSGWRAYSLLVPPFPLLNYPVIRRCFTCPGVIWLLWLSLIGPRFFSFFAVMAQKVQCCRQVVCKEVQGVAWGKVLRDEVRGDEKCQRELAEVCTF